MKKQIKLLGIITLTVVIGFALAVCNNGYSELPINAGCTHTYGEWTIKIAASCTEKGIDQRTCSSCGKMDTCDSSALSHEGVGAVQATCLIDGDTGTGICTRCFKEITGEVITAPGCHDWDWETYVSGNGPDGGIRKCQRNNCVATAGVGDTGPGGGIIFFVADGQGKLAGNSGNLNGGALKKSSFTFFQGADDTEGTICYYLEAAPSNAPGAGSIGSIRWSTATAAPFPDSSSANGQSIGTGKRNTDLIIAAETAARPANTYIYAAKAAKEYRAPPPYNNVDDWFLPSKDELNELASRRGEYGLPVSGYFWSSTHHDDKFAWRQFFNVPPAGGGMATNNKEDPRNDHVVRAIRAF